MRGGYGIFFDSAEGREIDDSGDIYPYSIRNNLSPGTDATLDKFTNNQFKPYDTLGPFPASTLSFLAVIESENPINPYVQSYNLSIERELARNTTLEVNYIGTHLFTFWIGAISPNPILSPMPAWRFAKPKTLAAPM